jgi:hypothetical protein
MSSERSDLASQFISPRDVFVKAILSAEDPTFDEKTLLKHIQLAGESKKRDMVFFIRDEFENKEVGTYSGKAFSTLLYFTHHKFRTTIDKNWFQHRDLASSTDKEIMEMLRTCHIMNPEDNIFSSKMCIIVLLSDKEFEDSINQ